jgi:HlyD family secretion protein
MESIGMDLHQELESAAPNRRRRIYLTLGILVLAAMAIFLWFATGRQAENAKPRFETRKVRQGDLTVTVGATGTLEPTNQVDVGSELSGIIQSVTVDFNDQVRIGQELARLDDTKLKAAVAKSEAALVSARASLREAKATATEARANYERMRHLRRSTDNRVPSDQDLETAKATLDRALAAEDSAQARIAEAIATLNVDRTNLEKSVIYSPINGVVLTRSVDPGQTVAASFQAPVLFTLAEDLALMELHVDVDEADVGLVREGQPAVFTVDAYAERSFPAVIRQVRYGAETTSGVVTYETVLTVSNADLTLRPGMTATAEITVQEVRDALLVPNAALRFVPPAQAATGPSGFMGRLMPGPPRRGGPTDNAGAPAGPKIWRLQDGQPVPVAVTLGQSDGQWTEVRAAELTPGAEVIVGTMEASR